MTSAEYSLPITAVVVQRGQFVLMGDSDRAKRLKEIGARMKEARKRSRKTQSDIAQELEVTVGAVSQWENGLAAPDLDYFQQFCRFAGASSEELLFGRVVASDPLLEQLIHIYNQLEPDGRDRVLGNANRVLADEKPGPAVHDPFPIRPIAARRHDPLIPLRKMGVGHAAAVKGKKQR